MLTKTITVRVSAEVKAEFDQIRERVDGAGFDVGATMRDTISNTRQIRNELEAIEEFVITTGGVDVVSRTKFKEWAAAFGEDQRSSI